MAAASTKRGTTVNSRGTKNTKLIKDDTTTKTKKNNDNDKNDNPVSTEEIRRAKEKLLIEEHLPPLGLAFVVLLCSGFLLVLNLRDFATTGKNLFGEWDEALLAFTKSTQWYEDSKGWKSTQGGFSAVMQVTTDENNMGGFFVRKLCGAAGLAVHFQKLLPFLFHPTGAQWSRGHFRPLLWTSIVANLALCTFFGFYFEDLKAADVTQIPSITLALLAIETVTMLFYLFTTKVQRGPAIALPSDKVPSSPTSTIVRNTCLVVTTFFSIVAIRDLFFPGQIIDVIPRDDIYLEWTNAFLHSPPDNSPEAIDQGLEAPLYVGDKFMCQLMALHILINSLYKYVSSVGIRFGSDGSGKQKATMIWKGQAIASGLMCFVYRLFTSSAKSASFDMRWHLMLLGYEGFMFFVYGYM